MMFSSVKVSVIMPSLNVADYIEECIQSVIHQSLSEIEIICIDAGSTDGTWEILSSYANQDSRIRLLQSDVRSYGYQVNMGIKESRGEFVAILETDDYIRENMYESLYLKAKQTEAEVVKADFDSFVTYENGNRFFSRSRMWNSGKSLYGRLCDTRNIDEIYVSDFSIWKGIYKRSFLLEYNIWLNESKGAAYQDIGFLQQVIAYASKVLYIDDSYYCYRMDREESSSNSVHGLEFVHQEFLWLIGKDEFLKEHINKKGFFRRMVSCLASEVPKTLRAVNYDVMSEHVYPHYIWLRNTILENAQEYLAEFELLYPEVSLMLADLDGYNRQLRTMEQQKIIKEVELLERISGKTVVVFGVGVRGERAVKFLYKNEIFNVVLTDNNKILWNTTKYGLRVWSPKESVKLSNDAMFLVANKKYSEEMKQQLIELGVDASRIIRYEDEIPALL